MNGNPFSVAFEDIDPIVEYTPYSKGDPNQGWEIAYSEGSVKSPKWNWQQGRGVGVHRTRAPGATFSFKFYGTSVMLYGDPQQSVFTISLDGGTPERRTGALADGQIAGYEDLSLAEHTIRLVVESPMPELAFDRAVFKLEFESSARNITIPFNQDWSSMKPSDWIANSPGDGALQPTLRSGFTKAHGATASLNFQGSAIWILGDVNRDHGQYSVMLDGTVSQWNGTSTYLGQAAVLYFQAGLDPKANHSVTFTNLDRASFSIQGAVVVASGANITTGHDSTTSSVIPPRPPAKGLSTAVIAGSAIAAVSAVLMCIVIAFMLMRRCRESRKGKRGSPITPILLNVSERPQPSHAIVAQYLIESVPAEAEESFPRGSTSDLTTMPTHTNSYNRDATVARPLYFQPDTSTMYSPSAVSSSAAGAPAWAGIRPTAVMRKDQPARAGVHRQSDTPSVAFQPPPYSRG